MAAPSHPAYKSCAVARHWLNLIENHERKEILGTVVPSFPFKAEVNAEAEVFR